MLENLFLTEWAIWFAFQGDESGSKDNYNENISLAYQLKSPSDLAYIWSNTPLHSLDNYLLREDSKQLAYLIDGKWRKVNSIQYFKKGISPKWEDPKNQNGGRFIFSVNKSMENRQQIYRCLVFYLIGQNYDHSEKINGFRFICTKNPNAAIYRVQIWVGFDKQDIQNLTHFKFLVTKLFTELNVDTKSVWFSNNRIDESTKQEEK